MFHNDLYYKDLIIHKRGKKHKVFPSQNGNETYTTTTTATKYEDGKKEEKLAI